MGNFLSRRGQGFRRRFRRVATTLWPRCYVLVIFGDGSFLVATISRLEPARATFAIDGEAGQCELAADLGALRVYRYVRAMPYPSPAQQNEIVH